MEGAEGQFGGGCERTPEWTRIARGQCRGESHQLFLREINPGAQATQPSQRSRRGWPVPPPTCQEDSVPGLTISPTHTGAGSHWSEPASRAHTSRAAGSSATSPGPGDTCALRALQPALRGAVGLWLWAKSRGGLEPSSREAARVSRDESNCGASPGGATRFWPLPTCCPQRVQEGTPHTLPRCLFF